MPGPQQKLRWSRFKNDDATTMHQVVADEVFPFLRSLGGDGSTYSGRDGDCGIDHSR